jgi:peptide/nickel transport system substrate-binding protein
MKRNWLYSTLAVVAIAAFVMTACGTPSTPTSAPPAAPTEPPAAATEVPAPTEAPAPTEPPPPPPAERKVATFIWTQEFDILNPFYTGMWFSAITQQLWSCWAWDFDDQSNPHPVLVTEMPSLDNGGISEDGTVITMKLRDDIVWSDGTPITSEDFVFTYEMVTDPGNAVASAYPYEDFVSVEAPDPQTVVITFAEPFASWQATMWNGLMPKHVLQPVFDADGTIDSAPWNLEPTVGCGPFVFDEWESGSFARFVANENYWLGRPKLDEIFIRFVPDDAAQVQALLAGDGDLGTFMAYSDVPILEEAGVQIFAVPSGYNEGWFFRVDELGHPAVRDVRVRQAIAMGFDRFAINEDLLLGLTEPAVTYWDNMPYANPDLEAWPYDPEAAAALLDEAGWVDSNGDGVRDKDGEELVLVHGTNQREIRKDVQAVAQQQLADIGVQLELQNFDSDIYFASFGEGGVRYTGDLDIFQYSSRPAYPDPDTSRFMCDQIPTDEAPDGANDMGLCDEELDALFELQVTQVDFAARQQTFWEISEIIFENVYWLGVWQDPDLFAIGPRIKNAKLSGATPFFNIAEWDM